MNRLILYGFFSCCCAAVQAQSTACGGCPAAATRLPISGHVTDAETARPIVHALVRWQGTGDVGEGNGVRVNDPSIHGQTETDANGGFILPHLTQGSYEVRVSAAGHRSAGQFLAEKRPGEMQRPPLKLPEEVCMKHFGRPDCTAPPRPDGNFILKPDHLHVEPISAQAQSVFVAKAPDFRGLPKVDAGALSPDGQKLAFVAWYPVTLDEEGLRSGCRGWIYDHRDGQIQEIRSSMPKEFCDEGFARVHWDGDAVVISLRGTNGLKPKLETIRWQDGQALGPLSRELQGESIYEGATFKTRENELILLPSPDGAYATAQLEDENCQRCKSMLVVNRSGSWEAKLDGLVSLTDPHFDLDSRLLAWFSTQGGSGNRSDSFDLDVVELGKDHPRRIPFPGFQRGGDLIAVQQLENGSIRLAYTIPEDCDPYGPAAPFRPEAGTSQGPKAAHLCFATIPASEP
jgi:carboxypeptidase family protein